MKRKTQPNKMLSINVCAKIWLFWMSDQRTGACLPGKRILRLFRKNVQQHQSNVTGYKLIDIY